MSKQLPEPKVNILCSVELFPSTIILWKQGNKEKSFLEASQTLILRRSLRKAEMAIYTFFFFPPGERTTADKLQWWKSFVLVVSWEKKKRPHSQNHTSRLKSTQTARNGGPFWIFLHTGQVFVINRPWLVSKCCSFLNFPFPVTNHTLILAL